MKIILKLHDYSITLIFFLGASSIKYVIIVIDSLIKKFLNSIKKLNKKSQLY